jgi:hypothetical protein
MLSAITKKQFYGDTPEHAGGRFMALSRRID